MRRAAPFESTGATRQNPTTSRYLEESAELDAIRGESAAAVVFVVFVIVVAAAAADDDNDNNA